MKRTTIFLSSGRVVLLAAALGAAATPLRGQEDAPRPQLHVVRTGETLWSIAEYYLGDPFLWPEIYRLNARVIEDPHWIFPGEELALVPSSTEVAVEPPVTTDPDREVEPPPPPQGEGLTPGITPAPPPPPTSAQGATVFAQNRRRFARTTFVPSADRGRRAPTRSQFYSAGFLTEEQEFSWTELLGIADASTLHTLRVSSSAMILRQVRLEAPEDATYRVGDSLLVAFPWGELPTWGQVIYPSGVVEVLSASGREIQAKIIMQFSVIEGGQIAMPVEPFRDRVGERTVAIENGMWGSIVAIRDAHPLPDLEDIVFIDRGRNDGVAVGDEFEVLLSREGFADAPDRRIALMQIVNVRDRSASAFILEVHDIGIGVGSPVRLVRKMPS